MYNELVRIQHYNWVQRNLEKVNNYNREYYIKNREKILYQCKIRRLKNPEKFREHGRIWRLQNKEKIQKYRRNNEKYKQYQKDYHSVYNKKYQKEKYHSNINYKISVNLRNRIKLAIKKDYKKSKMFILLGTNINVIKKYLEQTAPKEFTWEKYNLKGYHIDHKIPCSKFDLTKEEEQKKCFHYTNLQMMWCNDNWSKGGKT